MVISLPVILVVVCSVVLKIVQQELLAHKNLVPLLHVKIYIVA